MIYTVAIDNGYTIGKMESSEIPTVGSFATIYLNDENGMPIEADGTIFDVIE